jgi:hypothetical protein
MPKNPMQVCRTDTASPSRTPEFSSRTFLLRLPAAAAGQSSGYGSTHAAASSSTPATKLAVSLFAAPSVNAPAGPIIAGEHVVLGPALLTVADCTNLTTETMAVIQQVGITLKKPTLALRTVDKFCMCPAGREVDRLVASAVLDLEQQLLQRLGAGEHVAVPVLLRESPDCRVQQMPEGMGSQVSRCCSCCAC